MRNICCLITAFLFNWMWPAPSTSLVPHHGRQAITLYVDAAQGDDQNAGTTAAAPLKTIAKLQRITLHPGDTVKFKRNSAFTGPFYVNDSGTAENYIVLTAYGNSTDAAPKFTNPVFKAGNYGNCIRLTGSFIKVENLYFEHTSSYAEGHYPPGDNFLTVWEMGAVYIDKTAANCVVSHNEILDCPVGIKSYGKNALITYNYVHDCGRVLKKWGWGPIGIWFGGDDQEACYNRVINYRAEDPRIRWASGAGGADGGAFEIDDARYNKSHVAIHHNYTRDCQGFLEVTWTDVRNHPVYTNFQIHHNISDDYQQFIALWDGAICDIHHNTIIRRKKNANDWGVFNITQNNSHNRIRNNVIVTELDIPVFNVGLNGRHTPATVIENNLFYAASRQLNMGQEGPGTAPVYGDPLFKNYSTASGPADFMTAEKSPAANLGAFGDLLINK